MKRISLTLLLPLVTAFTVGAQSATEKTSAGDLKITPIAHGSLMFEFDGKIIYVDPWTRPVDLTKYPKADWIFVTDIHIDHYDAKAIELVRKPGTRIVGPAVVNEAAKEVLVIKNGETKTFDGLQVEAVPMYNIVRLDDKGLPRHEKGRGNGYVFNFGNRRLFVAGDTECVPEIKALKNIDIAFLPMNTGPTMSPQEAAQCALSFKPKILWAYHYGTEKPETIRKTVTDGGMEFRIGPSGF